MTVQLRYTGSDDREDGTFRDEARNAIYWPSERPVSVSRDAAGEYLEHDGWERVEDPEEDDRITHRPDGTTEDAGGAPTGAESSTQPEPAAETETDTDTTGDDEGDEPEAEVEPEADAETEGEGENEEFRGERADDTGDEVEVEDDESAFDPSDVLDANWQTVKSTILTGVVDDHLDDLEEAELERGEKTREASVISSIEERRAQLARNDATDTDTDTDTEGADDSTD